jgi:hypothetical protein
LTDHEKTLAELKQVIDRLCPNPEVAKKRMLANLQVDEETLNYASKKRLRLVVDNTKEKVKTKVPRKNSVK